MKEFYTLTKSGERVRVDADLAKQLVRSGKKNPEDFTVVEDSAEPTPLWSPEGSGRPGQFGASSADMVSPTGEVMPPTPLLPGAGTGEDIVPKFVREDPLALKAITAGVETIPTALSTINVGKKFPFVGVDSSAGDKISQAYADKYKRVVNSPNVLEDVATDPVSYIPGVGEFQAAKHATDLGKFAAKYGQHLIDPVVQGVSTGLERGDVSPAAIAAGIGASAGLRGISEGIGSLASKGFAKRGLEAMDIPAIQKAVPMFGGTAGAVQSGMRAEALNPIHNFYVTGMHSIYDEGLTKPTYFATLPGADMPNISGDTGDLIASIATEAEAALVNAYRRVKPGSPDLKTLALKKERIMQMVEDLRTLRGARGDGLTSTQVLEKAKQYSDVPEIANAITNNMLPGRGMGEPSSLLYAGSKYLALPQREFSLSAPISSGVGRLTDPENLTRASNIAKYAIPMANRTAVQELQAP